MKQATLITLILLLSLISATQPGCHFADKPTVKEFEGVITYHEKEKDAEVDVDDTVQLYYSHGNFVGIHSERSSKFHVVKDYYFGDGPLRLFRFNTSDSLTR